MTTTDQSEAAWKPCAEGDLPRLAAQHQRLRRRQFLARAGAATGSLAVVSVAAWMLAGPSGIPEKTYGGVSCSFVAEHAPQYLAGSLSEEVAGRLRTHVAECDQCRKVWGEQFASHQIALARPSAVGTLCKCSECRGGQVASRESAPAPTSASVILAMR